MFNLFLSNTLLFTHVLLSAGIFYACFCRLVKMRDTTLLELRVSVYFQSLTSCSLLIAPFIWGLEPGPWMCILLATTLLHFSVMRRIWIPGVPHLYVTDVGELEEDNINCKGSHLIELIPVPPSPYHPIKLIKQPKIDH